MSTKNECIVCSEEKELCTLNPCTHNSICFQCATTIMKSKNPVCPICRIAIYDIGGQETVGSSFSTARERIRHVMDKINERQLARINSSISAGDRCIDLKETATFDASKLLTTSGYKRKYNNKYEFIISNCENDEKEKLPQDPGCGFGFCAGCVSVFCCQFLLVSIITGALNKK